MHSLESKEHKLAGGNAVENLKQKWIEGKKIQAHVKGKWWTGKGCKVRQ